MESIDEEQDFRVEYSVMVTDKGSRRGGSGLPARAHFRISAPGGSIDCGTVGELLMWLDYLKSERNYGLVSAR